ncbi:MAG: cob(I)yrinic acid a,c-diamide adenosyltransferase [Opitutales bacterium]|nr:cob(I)yrinic acid a,c-diamide adenosyltransferase [Opitutales bacterium]
MSIVTKKGDSGNTSLRYGKKVPKTEDRVDAYGTIDELSSAIGLAKAFAKDTENLESLVVTLNTIQSQLLNVGGDLATDPTDHEIRQKPLYQEAYLSWMESEIAIIEKEVKIDGFVLSGVNPTSGAIHLARTICRRAERCILRILEKEEEPVVRQMLPYINRLSDFLWLLGERTAQI